MFVIKINFSSDKNVINYRKNNIQKYQPQLYIALRIDKIENPTSYLSIQNTFKTTFLELLFCILKQTFKKNSLQTQ